MLCLDFCGSSVNKRVVIEVICPICNTYITAFTVDCICCKKCVKYRDEGAKILVKHMLQYHHDNIKFKAKEMNLKEKETAYKIAQVLGVKCIDCPFQVKIIEKFS